MISGEVAELLEYESEFLLETSHLEMLEPMISAPPYTKACLLKVVQDRFQDLWDLKKELEQGRMEVAAINAQCERFERLVQALQVKLPGLEQEIALLRGTLAERNTQIGSLQGVIAAREAVIEQRDRQLAIAHANRERLHERISDLLFESILHLPRQETGEARSRCTRVQQGPQDEGLDPDAGSEELGRIILEMARSQPDEPDESDLETCSSGVRYPAGERCEECASTAVEPGEMDPHRIGPDAGGAFAGPYLSDQALTEVASDSESLPTEPRRNASAELLSERQRATPHNEHSKSEPGSSTWSEERRAKQRERMSALQASGRMSKEGQPLSARSEEAAGVAAPDGDRLTPEELRGRVAALGVSMRRVLDTSGVGSATLYPWLSGKKPKLNPVIEGRLLAALRRLEQDAVAVASLSTPTEAEEEAEPEPCPWRERLEAIAEVSDGDAFEEGSPFLAEIEAREATSNAEITRVQAEQETSRRAHHEEAVGLIRQALEGEEAISRESVRAQILDYGVSLPEFDAAWSEVMRERERLLEDETPGPVSAGTTAAEGLQIPMTPDRLRELLDGRRMTSVGLARALSLSGEGYVSTYLRTGKGMSVEKLCEAVTLLTEADDATLEALQVRKVQTSVSAASQWTEADTLLCQGLIPGNVEAVARARQYVLAQKETHREIKLSDVRALTGYDHREALRFVRAVEDELAEAQRREQGKPAR
jgi:hypothetical protein